MEVLNIQFSDVNSDKPFGFRDKKESGVVSSKKACIEVTQGEVKADKISEELSEEMNCDAFFGIQVALHREYAPRVPRDRVDPRTSMSDPEFKRHFRFTKHTVERIAEMLREDLEFGTNRGEPLSPVQQVCVALHHFGGGQFQRVTGLCGGISQNGARLALIRVTDALVKRRAEFIYMPSIEEMEETSQRIMERFKLPRFSMGVDGMMTRFEEAPRRLPVGKHKQLFWCRKQFYAVNTQVVANDWRICDLDVSWPGSTHDSRVWNRSKVKPYVEEQRRFLIAGDSGYPISEVLIKPFNINEASQDKRKRIFNKRHSGLRTVMTENIFAVWKRRFPVIKSLRSDFRTSQKIIVATAILFNLGRMWSDDDPEDVNGGEEDDIDEEPARAGFVVEDSHPSSVRIRGQAERQRLLENMKS